MQFSVDEYEIIFRRCHPRALAAAMSLLGNAEEARDMVQQVFANVWESKARIENPEAFIIRAVRNLCLSRLEQLHAKDRVRRHYAILSEADDYDADAMLSEVREAMERVLSERERQVVDEIFDKGCSYKEAAANLSLSASSINKYISSALKSLRSHFNNKKDK